MRADRAAVMEKRLTYNVIDTLWEEGEMGLYRVQGTSGPVLVRAARSDLVSPHLYERFTNEWELAECLEPAWALKPLELQPKALVLADFGGVSLETLLGPPMALGRFLAIAISLARALVAVHARDLVHRDLRPANVLVEPASGEVRLTGFGLAAQLTPAAPFIRASGRVEGTLAYLAPEQTGRTSWAVDTRSDLYALGAILYQLLTGELPCRAEDALGWIHCHVAREPRAPSSLRPEVPAPLEAIVLKLLDKTPDARYQTAGGLLWDLARCRDAWEAHGAIAPFPLAAHDVSGRFVMPRRLYGREAELAALEEAFERVVSDGTTEAVFLSGYAGIGKTALVQAASPAFVRHRAYFASGKYDQYKRNIPYAIASQAFDGLIAQILAESEASVAAWRARIQDAVGPNGRLVVEVVPRLALLLGAQPPTPELDPIERLNRFHYVFRRFFGAIARPEHPLVLFLDDLQWADAASLGLMAHLAASPEIRHLLLIGAYRSNEVSPGHPLIAAIEAIRQAPARVRELAVGPLSAGDVQCLVAELARAEPGQVEPLARLVHEKTAGNPFFVFQFLTALHEEGLLAYDREAGAWRWDLARIQAKGYTDNVADLMVRKLNRLAPPTQRTLQIAAACGAQVDVPTLAVIGDRPEGETRRAIREAEHEGLVQRDDGNYGFLHDRIQQAAYSMLPRDERAALHLQIGRLLLAHTPPERLEESLFEIVAQFNRAGALVTDAAELRRVAELNLWAGKKAKAASAYASAVAYLETARALAPPGSEEAGPPLSFEIRFHLAECHYLQGHLAEAERGMKPLLDEERSHGELAAITEVLMALYTMMGRPWDAIDLGLSILARLGVTLEREPTQARLEQAASDMLAALGDRPIESLIDMPPMTDPAAATAMAVLTAMIPVSFITVPRLSGLVGMSLVSLSLRHGNAQTSPYGYAWGGCVLSALVGDHARGFRFGRLGLALAEGRSQHAQTLRVLVILGAMVTHWSRPYRESLGQVLRAHDAAMLLGERFFSITVYNLIFTQRIATGEPLAAIDRDLEDKQDEARRYGYGLIVEILTGHRRLVRQLRGLRATFDDADRDQAAHEDHRRRLASYGQLTTCWYHIRKAMASYMFGEVDATLAACAEAEPLLLFTSGHQELADFHLYRALALAARYPRAGPARQEADLAAIEAHRAQFRRWSGHCPENFLHLYALVSAELAGITGPPMEAARWYEQAIASAEENGFVQHEGLAYEQAARFYRQRGFSVFGDAYMLRARACYVRWGADGKVRQLDERHPGLREGAPAGLAVNGTQLDPMAMLKAAQAISGEIVFDRLVATLMRLVIESAGAQQGYLVVERGHALWVQAEATSDKAPTSPPHPQPAAQALPATILAYVQRTHEKVLLDDAARPSMFAADPYVQRRKPRSVLCLPILRQADMVGMLYLENNLMAGAFTPDRLAVLEHLAAQAAISLENARLYQELQAETAARVRAAEEAVRRQAELDQARELDRLKNTFVHTVSHELRTPLTSIKGFIEFLEDGMGGPLNDAQLDFVQQIGKAAFRLELLANDLLDYARMDAGTFRLALAEADLAAEVREVADSFRPQAAFRQLDLRVSVPETPLLLRMDPMRIEQVLNNLLSNAIKFASQGGWVEVRLREEGDQALCEVEDTGEGIAPEDIPKLFQRFSQLESGTRKGGTGLGLSISKGIVEAHGGRIGVRSAPGQGSVFWFTLPRAPQADTRQALE